MTKFLFACLRILTGRVAYERKAALLAVEMAPHFKTACDETPEYAAARLYLFLLSGEFHKGHR